MDCSLLLDSAGLDPIRSRSVCAPLHRLPILLALSLKAQNAREICCSTRQKADRQKFLSIRHTECDVVSLLNTGLGYGERETFFKEPPPASPRLSPFCDLGAFHSSPCKLFHRCADGKQRRKGESSAGWRERQTDQFERPDKCNKAKVYFRAPSEWVLRYYITLFIQAPLS